MAHKFEFKVSVEVERESGKFASREEMAEQIMEAIEGADPGSLYGIGADGDSDYTVTDWAVEEA